MVAIIGSLPPKGLEKYPDRIHPGPGTFPEADRMPRMNVWRVLIVQRNPVDVVVLFFLHIRKNPTQDQ
jgi:hypothetical protein